MMAWRRPGDKPLSGAMMVNLLMHIYASLSLNELNDKDEDDFSGTATQSTSYI